MSAVLGKIEGIGNLVASKGKALIDSVFPPEKRSELLAKLQQFAIRNPKLSAFLLTNFVLTGPPLFLFILFTVTVLIFAIVVALIVGLLVAVGFTLFAVCVALFVLFPTVFFTTLAASFFFLWGLGGYYLLKWLNKGESPAPEGAALGDKLNSLTGGRLGFIMGPAREAEKNGDVGKQPSSGSEKEGHKEKSAPKKLNGSANGNTNGAGGSSGMKKNADVGKHAETIKKNANIDTVTDQAGLNGAAKQANLDGVQGKVGTTTGTLKGTVGGATGLA
ncbi:hypothetical protein AAFC00_000020 [Neodothiora populina]|uniref:Uncharacterized protein n=1 Tax=Neodothiora populina TaxID=2781224 RepID=A0ABR3P1H0_9PEZI